MCIKYYSTFSGILISDNLYGQNICSLYQATKKKGLFKLHQFKIISESLYLNFDFIPSCFVTRGLFFFLVGFCWKTPDDMNKIVLFCSPQPIIFHSFIPSYLTQHNMYTNIYTFMFICFLFYCIWENNNNKKTAHKSSFYFIHVFE